MVRLPYYTVSRFCNPARLHRAMRGRRHSAGQLSSGLLAHCGRRITSRWQSRGWSIATRVGASCSCGPLVLAGALPPGRGEAAYLESMAPALPRPRPRLRKPAATPARHAAVSVRAATPASKCTPCGICIAVGRRGSGTRRALVCCAPSHRARRRLPPVPGPRSGGSLDISRRRPCGSIAGASGRFRPVERCSPPGASGVGFGARSLKLPVGCRVRV